MSPFRFHISIIMDCLHSNGAIPICQTTLHTLHSSYTPASPAAFIISMVIPSIPGAFSVFGYYSDFPTCDSIPIYGSCSRMCYAENVLPLLALFGYSSFSK